MQSTNTIRVTKFSEDPVLEVRAVYYGDYAENVRAALANAPAAELEKSWVNEYVRSYPGATPLQALQVDEVAQQNSVALSMRYRLTDYLKLNKQRQLSGEHYLATLMESLRLPTQAPRTLPVRINGQGVYRESVDAVFPEDVFPKGMTDRYDERNSIFDLRENIRGDVRSMHLDAELRLLTDTIPAADWPAHLQHVQQAFQRLGGTLSVPSAAPDQIDRIKTRLAAPSKDYDQGKYKKASSPDPRNAEAHSALAVNALLRGQYEQSRNEATALSLAPALVGPRYTRADYANYFGAGNADARAELVDILKDPAEVERGYASVWLYFSARGAGEDGAAAIARYLPTGQQPDPNKQCKLYFYTGQKSLADGNVAKAREYFQRSLDTGVVEFNEYAFSAHELQRLKAQ